MKSDTEYNKHGVMKNDEEEKEDHANTCMQKKLPQKLKLLHAMFVKKHTLKQGLDSHKAGTHLGVLLML